MSAPVCRLCSARLGRTIEMGNPRPWPELRGTLYDCPECHTSLTHRDDPAEVQESVLIAAMHAKVMTGLDADDVQDFAIEWLAVERSYDLEGDEEGAKRCRANSTMMEFFLSCRDLSTRAVAS